VDSALFDYSLPEALIAQKPTGRRDDSKLLVVNRRAQTLSHAVFRDLPAFLPSGAMLFRNNARVLRARLPGLRPSGGRVECLLLREAEAPDVWWCLLRPGKKAAAAGEFSWPGAYEAVVIGRQEGQFRIRFSLPPDVSVLSLSEKIGDMPLPPYIGKARQRDAADYGSLDKERYQTLYADPARAVAAAAPTAGLHFSQDVLDSLAARGIQAYDLTLHVGLGTFQPIKTGTIEEHRIHREHYEIPQATRAALAQAHATQAPRLAVGTTTLRALEDYARKQPSGIGTYCDEAALFIYPPQSFLGADLLLTNFHLPRSTLICLVAAFLTPGSVSGIAWLKELYAEAVARGYRFYSYGDAMLLA
jgi:S-adenosylmethionine:tRNA ribosyltransferase-isomerase